MCSTCKEHNPELFEGEETEGEGMEEGGMEE